MPLKVAKYLRDSDINTEVYFENGKMAKKLEYADKRNIPFVIIVGENEIKDDVVTIKDMKKKKQETVNVEEAVEMIKDKK